MKQKNNRNNDVICIGTALIDSIIKGFDPQPISASGYTAQSGTLNIGGEAVNEAVTFAKLGTNLAHRHNFHPETRDIARLHAKAVSIGSLFRSPFDDPAIIHAVLSQAKAGGMAIFADTKIPNFHPLTLDDIKDSLPLIVQVNYSNFPHQYGVMNVKNPIKHAIEDA